jgi:signal peptidase I
MNISKKSTFIHFFIIAIAITIGITLRNFVVSARFVEGNSMSPAIHNGDIVLINMWNKKFAIGDIVVFKTHQKSPDILIKRIVGLENSNIHVDNFKVYLNNQLIPEESTYHPLWDFTAFECRFSNSVKSKANEFLVFGDNRCNSGDSRSFGGITKENIIGTVLYLIKLSKIKNALGLDRP